MSQRLRMQAGPASLLAAAVVASVANFAFHAIGSRLLGPTDYSSLAALMALLVVVAVPVGAVQTSVTQASASASDASAAATVERIARTGLILLCIGVFSAIPLNQALALHDAWGVALTAAWAAVACTGAVAKGALLGRLRYGPVATALIVGAIMRVLFGVVFMPILHVEGAMLATLISEAFATTLALIAMRGGLLSVRAPALRPRGTDATIALAAQLGLWLLAGVMTIVGRRVLPASEAGNFAAAATVTNAATFLPLAVATAFFPRFTRDGSRRTLTRALAMAALFGGAAALVLAVMPNDAVQFFAGGSFRAEPAVVGMLALQSALVGCTGVAVFFLLARRRPAALSIWIGAAFACLGAFIAHDAQSLAAVALFSATCAATLTITAALRATAVRDHIDMIVLGLPEPDRLVSVVVPSYNGGTRLRPTVEALCRSLDATGWRYEVLVEIDGSTDGSAASLAGLPPEVVVHTSEVNEGKGTALRRGFARARGVYIGFIDGDGDIDVNIVRRLARACQAPNVWAAIASKHTDGAEVEMSVARATLSRGYRHLVRLLFGLDVTDTQCGAKVFARRGLERVLPWARERGFAVDVELLGLGRRFGVGDVVELPVRLSREPHATTVSARHVLRTLEETLRVWSRVLDAPVALTVSDPGRALASVDLTDAKVAI